MAKLTKEQIIESLKEMTILEIDEVIKAIEEAFNVTAAVMTTAAASGASAATANENEEVSVIIQDVGPNKIPIIKLYREISGLGLMDAKNAVEKTPCVVKENIKLDEANELKKKFEEAGAKIEIK